MTIDQSSNLYHSIPCDVYKNNHPPSAPQLVPCSVQPYQNINPNPVPLIKDPVPSLYPLIAPSLSLNDDRQTQCHETNQIVPIDVPLSNRVNHELLKPLSQTTLSIPSLQVKSSQQILRPEDIIQSTPVFSKRYTTELTRSPSEVDGIACSRPLPSRQDLYPCINKDILSQTLQSQSGPQRAQSTPQLWASAEVPFIRVNGAPVSDTKKGDTFHQRTSSSTLIVPTERKMIRETAHPPLMGKVPLCQPPISSPGNLEMNFMCHGLSHESFASSKIVRDTDISLGCTHHAGLTYVPNELRSLHGSALTHGVGTERTPLQPSKLVPDAVPSPGPSMKRLIVDGSTVGGVPQSESPRKFSVTETRTISYEENMFLQSSPQLPRMTHTDVFLHVPNRSVQHSVHTLNPSALKNVVTEPTMSKGHECNHQRLEATEQVRMLNVNTISHTPSQNKQNTSPFYNFSTTESPLRQYSVPNTSLQRKDNHITNIVQNTGKRSSFSPYTEWNGSSVSVPLINSNAPSAQLNSIPPLVSPRATRATTLMRDDKRRILASHVSPSATRATMLTRDDERSRTLISRVMKPLDASNTTLLSVGRSTYQNISSSDTDTTQSHTVQDPILSLILTSLNPIVRDTTSVTEPFTVQQVGTLSDKERPQKDDSLRIRNTRNVNDASHPISISNDTVRVIGRNVREQSNIHPISTHETVSSVSPTITDTSSDTKNDAFVSSTTYEDEYRFHLQSEETESKVRETQVSNTSISQESIETQVSNTAISQEKTHLSNTLISQEKTHLSNTLISQEKTHLSNTLISQESIARIAARQAQSVHNSNEEYTENLDTLNKIPGWKKPLGKTGILSRIFRTQTDHLSVLYTTDKESCAFGNIRSKSVTTSKKQEYSEKSINQLTQTVATKEMHDNFATNKNQEYSEKSMNGFTRSVAAKKMYDDLSTSVTTRTGSLSKLSNKRLTVSSALSSVPIEENVTRIESNLELSDKRVNAARSSVPREENVTRIESNLELSDKRVSAVRSSVFGNEMVQIDSQKCNENYDNSSTLSITVLSPKSSSHLLQNPPLPQSLFSKDIRDGRDGIWKNHESTSKRLVSEKNKTRRSSNQSSHIHSRNPHIRATHSSSPQRVFSESPTMTKLRQVNHSHENLEYKNQIQDTSLPSRSWKNESDIWISLPHQEEKKLSYPNASKISQVIKDPIQNTLLQQHIINNNIINNMDLVSPFFLPEKSLRVTKPSYKSIDRSSEWITSRRLSSLDRYKNVPLSVDQNINLGNKKHRRELDLSKRHKNFPVSTDQNINLGHNKQGRESDLSKPSSCERNTMSTDFSSFTSERDYSPMSVTPPLKNDISVQSWERPSSTPPLKNDISVQSFGGSLSTPPLKNDISVQSWKEASSTPPLKNDIRVRSFGGASSTPPLKNDINVQSLEGPSSPLNELIHKQSIHTISKRESYPIVSMPSAHPVKKDSIHLPPTYYNLRRDLLHRTVTSQLVQESNTGMIAPKKKSPPQSWLSPVGVPCLTVQSETNDSTSPSLSVQHNDPVGILNEIPHPPPSTVLSVQHNRPVEILNEISHPPLDSTSPATVLVPQQNEPVGILNEILRPPLHSSSMLMSIEKEDNQDNLMIKSSPMENHGPRHHFSSSSNLHSIEKDNNHDNSIATSLPNEKDEGRVILRNTTHKNSLHSLSHHHLPSVKMDDMISQRTSISTHLPSVKMDDMVSQRTSISTQCSIRLQKESFHSHLQKTDDTLFQTARSNHPIPTSVLSAPSHIVASRVQTSYVPLPTVVSSPSKLRGEPSGHKILSPRMESSYNSSPTIISSNISSPTVTSSNVPIQSKVHFLQTLAFIRVILVIWVIQHHYLCPSLLSDDKEIILGPIFGSISRNLTMNNQSAVYASIALSGFSTHWSSIHPKCRIPVLQWEELYSFWKRRFFRTMFTYQVSGFAVFIITCPLWASGYLRSNVSVSRHTYGWIEYMFGIQSWYGTISENQTILRVMYLNMPAWTISSLIFSWILYPLYVFCIRQFSQSKEENSTTYNILAIGAHCCAIIGWTCLMMCAFYRWPGIDLPQETREGPFQGFYWYPPAVFPEFAVGIHYAEIAKKLKITNPVMLSMAQVTGFSSLCAFLYFSATDWDYFNMGIGFQYLNWYRLHLCIIPVMFAATGAEAILISHWICKPFIWWAKYALALYLFQHPIVCLVAAILNSENITWWPHFEDVPKFLIYLGILCLFSVVYTEWCEPWLQKIWNYLLTSVTKKLENDRIQISDKKGIRRSYIGDASSSSGTVHRSHVPECLCASCFQRIENISQQTNKDTSPNYDTSTSTSISHNTYTSLTRRSPRNSEDSARTTIRSVNNRLHTNDNDLMCTPHHKKINDDIRWNDNN